MADEGPFSVKDYLAIHTKALERIERKMDEVNAEQIRFNARTDTRLALIESLNLDPRVRVLEEEAGERRGERGFRRFLWPSLAAVLGGAWWVPDIFKHVNH